MKITVDDDDFYAIFVPHSGTQPLCFWGDSPYGGLCTCNGINRAWRFSTRKEAQAEIRKHPDEGEAKVVRVNMRTTATIYMKNR